MDAGEVLSMFGIGFLNTSFVTSPNVSELDGLSFVEMGVESRSVLALGFGAATGDKLLFSAR